MSSEPQRQTPPPHQSSRRVRRRLDGGESSTTRVPVACRACRDRKTRCSGDQPSCNYCRDAGIPCFYSGLQWLGASTSAGSGVIPDALGPRLTDAIERVDRKLDIALEALVHEQETVIGVFPDPFRIPQLQNRNISGTVPSSFEHEISRSRAILSWPVFSDMLVSSGISSTDLLSNFDSPNNTSNSKRRSNASGSIAEVDLMRLRNSFAANTLPILPVIEMDQLDRSIVQLNESGAEWSSTSCLIFLVAALGTTSQISVYDDSSRGVSQTNSSNGSMRNASLVGEAASLYWNMAKKRLAWALEEDGLVSAQCLLLAGIWYLRDHEPFKAWKMFKAGMDSILYAHSAMTSGASHLPQHPDDQELVKRVFWNLYKYQHKVYVDAELVVPDPRQYLQSTPDATALLGTCLREISGVEEVLGYKSADAKLFRIHKAARHAVRLHHQLSLQSIVFLSTELSEIQRKLDHWHQSLPPLLQFSLYGVEESTDHTRSGPEGFQMHDLQCSYFEVQEFILRPWLYLCLWTDASPSSASSTSEDLMRNRLLIDHCHLASQHMSCVLTRLEIEFGRLEHIMQCEGSFFVVQRCYTLGLLLLAGKRGMSKGIPAMQKVQMPDNWESSLDRAVAELDSARMGLRGKKYSQILQRLKLESRSVD